MYIYVLVVTLSLKCVVIYVSFSPRFSPCVYILYMYAHVLTCACSSVYTCMCVLVLHCTDEGCSLVLQACIYMYILVPVVC